MLFRSALQIGVGQFLARAGFELVGGELHGERMILHQMRRRQPLMRATDRQPSARAYCESLNPAALITRAHFA